MLREKLREIVVFRHDDNRPARSASCGKYHGIVGAMQPQVPDVHCVNAMLGPQPLCNFGGSCASIQSCGVGAMSFGASTTSAVTGLYAASTGWSSRRAA